MRGFALKITPAGGKAFIVDWQNPGGKRTRKGRYTIGSFGHGLTVDQAREAAREVLTIARSGQDPNQLKRDEANGVVSTAFDKIAERFVDEYAKENQPRTWKDAERTLAKDVTPVWRSRPLHEITRADVHAILSPLAKRAPQQSRYTHATLRKLFRWAVNAGLLMQSPMSEMQALAKVVVRDRFLSDEELTEVWNAAEKLGDPYGAMVKLLIATGQRRDEVSGMAWEELDLERKTWTIPGSRAKNGKAHIVPINALAMATIEALATADWAGRDLNAAAKKNGLLFSSKKDVPPSGWGKVKARLDGMILNARKKAALEAGDPPKVVEVMKLKPWRIHDLRRTMATGFQKLGVRLEVTEAALNHVGGSRAGIVGVYQRHDWAIEKRAALDAWSAHVSALLAGKSSPGNNVVKLAERKGRKRSA